MSRRPLLVAAALCALAVPAAPAVAACPGADTQLSLVTIGSARDAVLCLVNEERASRDLGTLQHDALLQAAAQAHSEDMVLRDYFEHIAPDGSDPGDRITRAGYEWAAYGENIAEGHRTPREVMEGWMNSEGHRANILSPQFTELGVGISVLSVVTGAGMWTQNFGHPLDGSDDEEGDEVALEEEIPAGQTPGPQDVDVPLVTTVRPLTLGLERTAEGLVVRGKVRTRKARRARIRVVQDGITVARRKVPIVKGRYRARLTVPAGRLRVIVRVGKRRTSRIVT